MNKENLSDSLVEGTTAVGEKSRVCESRRALVEERSRNGGERCGGAAEGGLGITRMSKHGGVRLTTEDAQHHAALSHLDI